MAEIIEQKEEVTPIQSGNENVTPQTGEVKTGEVHTPAEEEEKVPAWAKKRFDELTREKYEAKKKIQYLEQRLSQRETPPIQPPAKPKQEDFETWDAYQEAVVEWNTREKVTKILEEQEASRKRTEMQTVIETKMTKAKHKYSDFETVSMNPELTFSPYLNQTIIESDKFEDIVYFLGNNTEEAKRIRQMDARNPALAIKEIGKLESKFEVAPVKNISQAPEPIKSVSGNSNVSGPDDETISISDFMKRRNEAQFKRR